MPVSLQDWDTRAVSLSRRAHSTSKAKAAPPQAQLLSRLLHRIPPKEHCLPLLRVLAAQGAVPNARQMVSPRKTLWSGGNVPQISPNRDKLGPGGFKDTFREERDLLASHAPLL